MYGLAKTNFSNKQAISDGKKWKKKKKTYAKRQKNLYTLTQYNQRYLKHITQIFQVTEAFSWAFLEIKYRLENKHFWIRNQMDGVCTLTRSGVRMRSVQLQFGSKFAHGSVYCFIYILYCWKRQYTGFSYSIIWTFFFALLLMYSIELLLFCALADCAFLPCVCTCLAAGFSLPVNIP